jgi:undecaprenyl-diphosphatase
VTRRPWLLVSLPALVLAAVGLRGLSTLVRAEDLTAVRDLAGARTATLSTIAHGASWLGRSWVLIPCALVIALAAIALRRPAAWMIVVGTVGAVILQNAAKALIERPRPPVHRLEQVSGTSFPSGHATEATAFFVLLAVWMLRSPRSGPVRAAVVVATIAVIGAVATSRVYLGAHYPTDVVAGIVLGASWAVLTVAAYGRPRS